MRTSPDRLLTCHLTAIERDAVEALKSLSGLNDADVARLAFWHLAKHYDLPLGSRTFAIRRQKSHRRTARQVPA